MKNYINIAVLLLGIFIQSCSSSYYASNANVSMFKAKNELKGNMGISPSSANIDLSYSITDNFMVAGSAFGFIQKETSVLNKTYKASHGYSFSIAPGYYMPFGHQGVLEVLAGYGYNYSNSHDVNGNFHKFYIQPSIGISKRYFEMAFTPRVTAVFINQYSFIDHRDSQYDMFIEPIGTIKAGGENFKITTQLGFTIPTAALGYQINPIYWNFGFQLHLRNKKGEDWSTKGF